MAMQLKMLSNAIAAFLKALANKENNGGGNVGGGSVLIVLLSRQTKNKEWCSLCKWRQHALKDSLFENYELS